MGSMKEARKYHAPDHGRAMLRGCWKGQREGLAKRLTIVFVAAAALSASGTASAAHFYGVIINTLVPAGDADLGASIQIRTDALTSAACSTFVNHEWWYGVGPGLKFWVEVGFHDGHTSGGCNHKQVFWADNRSAGGGYHEHFPGNSWNLGTWYNPWIEYDGVIGCAWHVRVGSVQLGVSTVNCPGTGFARSLEAGIEAETTVAGNQVKGWIFDLAREDSTGTWQTGWDSPVLSSSSPPFIQWTDSSHTETEEVLNVAP